MDFFVVTLILYAIFGGRSLGKNVIAPILKGIREGMEN